MADTDIAIPIAQKQKEYFYSRMCSFYFIAKWIAPGSRVELRHLLKPLSIAQTTDSPGTRQPILAKWARAIAADWEERGSTALKFGTSPKRRLGVGPGMCF